MVAEARRSEAASVALPLPLTPTPIPLYPYPYTPTPIFLGVDLMTPSLALNHGTAVESVARVTHQTILKTTASYGFKKTNLGAEKIRRESHVSAGVRERYPC